MMDFFLRKINQYKRHSGFTFLELLIAIAIVIILAGSVEVVRYRRAREKTSKSVCAENRRVIELSEMRFKADTGSHSQALGELVAAGYLSRRPVCPGGGIYAWLPRPEEDSLYQSIIGCSVHGTFDTGISEYENIISYDFNDGGSDGWTTTGSNWDVIDKKFQGGPGGEHRAFYGEDSWSNYTVEVKAALLAGSGSAQGYGIYFRSTGFNEPDTLNSYIFQYDPGYAGGEFLIRKVVSGGERPPIARFAPPAGYDWKGSEKKIRIEVSGESLRAYISDINGGTAPVLEVNDSTFLSGAVGFRTWSDSVASFDDLLITIED